MLIDTKTIIDSISTVPEVHITLIRSSHNVVRYKGKNIKPMTNIISTVPEVHIPLTKNTHSTVWYNDND